MTKRIAQRSLLAPAEGLKLPLELCSSRYRTLNGSGDIPDFKVEMHRRPVSTVVTKHFRDRTAKEPSPETKTERVPIELDGAFKVVHINVHQKLHGATPSMTPNVPNKARSARREMRRS